MDCRYIPTKLETKLFPSVKITDEKIPSVIPLVFADFLVVKILNNKIENYKIER